MEAQALARQVIAKLRAAGHQAYLVGGCVRDLLLGVQPKDFDVATDARPDRIMDLFPRSGQVGNRCFPLALNPICRWKCRSPTNAKSSG